MCVIAEKSLANFCALVSKSDGEKEVRREAEKYSNHRHGVQLATDHK